MDLDSVSNELYAAKREEFTALRDERAKQARPDRPLVDKIAGLRKPTVAAWLVNQVSRACPEEIDRLASVGESLRDAHQRLAGAELRTLSRQRHEVVELLTQRARWLARKAGYAFADATQRQVVDTFEAALGDSRALDAIRAARLSAAMAPGAPETWLVAAVLPAASAPARGTVNTAARARRREDQAAQRAPREAEVAAQRAQREAAARREASEAAARREAAARDRLEADEAMQARESAEQAVTEAEEALADAEQLAEEAAAEVRDAAARLEDARAADRVARAAVTSARKSVTTALRTAKTAARRAAEAEARTARAADPE